MSKLNTMLTTLMAMGMMIDPTAIGKVYGLPPGSKPYEPERQSEESKLYYLKRAEEKAKRKGWKKWLITPKQKL